MLSLRIDFQRLEAWRTSVDVVLSELQSRLTYVEVKQMINERIWDNRRVTVGEIKSKSSVSHGNIYKNCLRSSLLLLTQGTCVEWANCIEENGR
jgi:hypothetical protein